MNDLRVIACALLLGLGVSSCGPESAPDPVAEPAAVPSRTVHLLDRAEDLVVAEGEIERDLPPPFPVILSDGRDLGTQVEFELPWPALGAGELQVQHGDDTLAPDTDGAATLEAGRFRWLPGTARVGPGDEVDFLGRQTRNSVHGRARYLFFDGHHVTFDLELVDEPATLHWQVRTESGARVALRLLVDGEEVATTELGSGPWTDWTVPLEPRRGPVRARLEVAALEEGPRTRLVASLQELTLERARHDRVQVSAGIEQLRVRYSGRLPQEQMTLAPTASRPEVVALRSPGGPIAVTGNWQWAEQEGTGQRVDRNPAQPNWIEDLSAGLWWFHGVEQELGFECLSARRWPWLLDPNTLERDDLVARHLSDPALVPLEQRLWRRLTCQGDVRAGWWLPTPTRVALQVVVQPGDRLRLAVGRAQASPSLVADADADPAGSVVVVWNPDSGQQAWTLPVMAGPWQDAEIPLGDHPGSGRLEFHSIGLPRDHATPLAVADPRLVPAQVTRERPNVLLYVIDTLRADRLHFYDGAEISPALDRLAKEGFLFEDFRAVASWTRPTMASVMTGLFPHYHGILGDDRALPLDVLTLAELLRADGYSTWGAVSNVQLGAPGMGFDQGFHRFVTPWGLGIADPQMQVEPSSRLLRECMEPWMERHQDETFFAWWHSMDPHIPYLPTPGYLEEYAGDYAGPLKDVPLLGVGEVWSRIQQLGDADFEYLRQVYDAEIKGQDDEIGRLWNWLEDTGLREDTILIVLSDHGEEFLEHDGLTHAGRMWEELLSVPLLVWIPERWRQPGWTPRRISTSVSQVDLLSGVLELLGMEDQAPRQGQSFVRLLEQDAPEARAVLSYETPTLGALTFRGWKLLWKPAAASADGVAPEEPVTWHLYHLTEDAREQVDLAATESERLAQMRRLKEQVEVDASRGGSLTPREGRPVILDDETRRQLKALGYLEGD